MGDSSMAESISTSPQQEQRKGLKCEVCGCNKALYTCPGCAIKSCSATCVKQHKSESSCDGKRKRLEYVRREELNESHLQSDLSFLLHGIQEVDQTKRLAIALDEDGLTSKTVQKSRKRLVAEAKRRDCVVALMPASMSKHVRNTSRFDPKTSRIMWHVEWTESGSMLQSQDAIDESREIRTILPFDESMYQSVKLEVRNGSALEVTLDTRLQDCLKGKEIIEFPTFRIERRPNINEDISTRGEGVDIDPQSGETGDKRILEDTSIHGTIHG